MRIEPGSKSILRFKQRYRQLFTVAAVLSQMGLTAALGVLMNNTGIASASEPFLWVILLAVFILGTVISLVLLHFMLEPMEQILTALMHKVGETTQQPLPNPNLRRYTRNGFNTVLQAIYHCPEQTEEKDNAKDSLLTQALNITSSGIILLDKHRAVISANRAAPIATNTKGRPCIALDFLNEQSIFDWLDEIKDTAINAEHQWQRIPTDPNMISEPKMYDIVASYQKGAPAETVIMLLDRSDRYLPEEEDVNFIAFAAHELRGPITVIRGYLDVLSDELSDRLVADEAILIERLTVSANRLSNYVNNILNVAKFDRHHLTVHLREDTISQIYASIADDMQLRASAQQRLLTINIPENLPTVAADRGSVSEVIGNLVDNAIKYSFEGGTVAVKAEQKGDFVEVSITDNGVGMPPNVVKNLFHKFYRSHRSREAVAGTGIGLYICKAFVESHGGTISARSKENEGSTFSFTLPIYATVKDKLLEDGQLNSGLIKQGGGWIKNRTPVAGMRTRCPNR